MKRFALIAFVLASVILQAHEVSFIYSVIDEDTSNQTVEKGWDLNFVALRWGNNDFSNYALSVLFSSYGSSLRTDLEQAWLRFPIYKDLNLRVGKQILDFSASSKSGSC